MKVTIKKILKKILIIIIVLIIIYGLFTIIYEKPTFADSGFSTSHDSGGSIGGGSSSIGGSDRSGNGTGSILGVLVTTVVIIAIVYISNKKEKRLAHNDSVKSEENRVKEDRMTENKIRQVLPIFNREEFLSECERIYRNTQDAIMKSDLESVKEIVDDNMYAILESQLVVYESNGIQYNLNNFIITHKYLQGAIKQSNTLTVSVLFVINGGEDQKITEKYRLNYSIDLSNPNKKWILTGYSLY